MLFHELHLPSVRAAPEQSSIYSQSQYERRSGLGLECRSLWRGHAGLMLTLGMIAESRVLLVVGSTTGVLRLGPIVRDVHKGLHPFEFKF